MTSRLFFCLLTLCIGPLPVFYCVQCGKGIQKKFKQFLLASYCTEELLELLFFFFFFLERGTDEHSSRFHFAAGFQLYHRV